MTGCLGQTEAPRNSAAQTEGNQGQGLDSLAWQEAVTQAHSVTRPGASPVSPLLSAETLRKALERKIAVILFKATRAQVWTCLMNTRQAATGVPRGHRQPDRDHLGQRAQKGAAGTLSPLSSDL